MAISSNAVWECRGSTGNDINGGGFVPGTGNIDYSQQDVAQLALRDLHAAQNSTTVTSLTSGFTAAMTGNVIQITSGTNFVVGFYQISTFVNKATLTLDRAPATAGIGSNGGCYVGGALKSLTKLNTAFNGVDSQKAYVTGSFTTTGTITWNNSVGSGFRSRIIGYGSVRGDSGYAVLTAINSGGITCFNFTGNPGHHWEVSNWIINCNGLSTSTGISFVIDCFAINCKVYNFTSVGIKFGGGLNIVSDCEVSGGTSAATAAIQCAGGEATILRNYVHDNACVGIITSTSIGQASSIAFNIVANNSGASSDGISFSTWDNVLNNTVHNSGRHGLVATTLLGDASIKNNILTSNGGYGISILTTAMPALFQYDGNAFYNNTSGARNNMDAITGNFGVNPYTNVLDVTLTSLPYIGPASGSAVSNFGLNNVGGGGAACKAVGVPGTWLGTVSKGYMDMGAVQHKDGGIKYIIS